MKSPASELQPALYLKDSMLEQTEKSKISPSSRGPYEHKAQKQERQEATQATAIF